MPACVGNGITHDVYQDFYIPCLSLGFMGIQTLLEIFKLIGSTEQRSLSSLAAPVSQMCCNAVP